MEQKYKANDSSTDGNFTERLAEIIKKTDPIIVASSDLPEQALNVLKEIGFSVTVKKDTRIPAMAHNANSKGSMSLEEFIALLRRTRLVTKWIPLPIEEIIYIIIALKRVTELVSDPIFQEKARQAYVILTKGLTDGTLTVLNTTSDYATGATEFLRSKL